MIELFDSHLHGCEYDEETKTLAVMFSDGRTYEYEDVPQDVFQQLVGSPTPGYYFRNIIKTNYEGQRVTE